MNMAFDSNELDPFSFITYILYELYYCYLFIFIFPFCHCYYFFTFQYFFDVTL